MMRRVSVHLVLASLVLTLAARAAEAQAPNAKERGPWVSAGGGYQESSQRFTSDLSFTQYLETNSALSEYNTVGGPVVEVTGGWPLWRGLVVQGGASMAFPSSGGNFIAAVPHPFLFGQPRIAEVGLEELSRRELTFRAELGYAYAITPRLTVELSGGPALMQLRQELVTDIQIAETGFPYDTVTATPVIDPVSEWGLGGTGALEMRWYLGEQVAIGVTGRWTGSLIDLTQTGRTAVFGQTERNCGGTSVVAAVRYHWK